MKQMTASLAALVLGVAVGVGIGFIVTKPKLDQSQKKVNELQTQMQAAKTESESAMRKASQEIARTQTTLSRNQTLMAQRDAELARLRTELAKAQSQIKTLTAPAEIIEPEPTAQPAAAAVPTGSTTDYVVKDGDNLWKIAEQQLGNGMRYKEILQLNPNITEKQTLAVGTKLKLPAQKN
jgi:nucleoid-associated protein YgaU